MKQFHYLILCLAIGACVQISGAAEDGLTTFTLQTRQGKKFEQARVLGFDSDGIRLMHKDGVARVAYVDMTDEQRRKYGQHPVLEVKAAEVVEGQNAEAGESRVQPARVETSEERAAAGFRVFRARILESIEAMDFEYAAQDALLLKWIGIYEEYGRKQWADVLRGDRDLLREKEVQRTRIAAVRKPAELTGQNARLQEQVDSLRAAVLSNRSRLESSSSLQTGTLDRATTYRSYPYYTYYTSYPRYYSTSTPYEFQSYRTVPYWYRSSVYIQPRVVCPTPRPAPSYRGGTLNANMNSHGAGN